MYLAPSLLPVTLDFLCRLSYGVNFGGPPVQVLDPPPYLHSAASAVLKPDV